MTQLINTHPVLAECAHCGDQCTDATLISPQKSFCCKGCQTVYELFHQNGLQQYYDLENTPGTSFKSIREEKYAYLDDDDVQNQLLDFKDGTRAKITLYLPEIHCISCIWLLEHLHKLAPEIQHTKVNFLKKEVYITYSPTAIKLSKIIALLQQIGYPASIQLADLNKEHKPLTSKTLYHKLGLTGFIFGNIMFLSFPEYFGLDKSVESFYYQLFAYLNLILALPLIFYSGWDYLRSAFLGLKQGVLNIDLPISIGILSLFGRSVYEIISQSGAGYLDALAGLIFFLLVGKWFQQKTYHSISFERDYQSYFPVAATKIVKGNEKSISLKKLKTGDQLRIRHQELIPADATLLSGEAYIDYSFVTGESVPVRVREGELIYAGGRQTASAIEIRLTKAVVQSYLVQLWNDQSFDHKNKHQQSSALANKVGKYFTIAILFIATATLFYWLPKNTATAINAFSAVLIIACPCAVALSIPFTFGNVLRILGRYQFYLKNIGVIENIQNVTHIVFDKTGTLTERKEKMHFHGFLNTEEKSWIKSLANQSNHPRSEQIKSYFPKAAILPIQQFKSIPGQGVYGVVENKKISICKSKQGTAIKIDGIPKGYFEHLPKLRKGLKTVIQKLKETHTLYLLSGDRNRHLSYFETLFGESDQLHFNHSPKEKLTFIKTLQENGAVVMMVGDGLNDAGALQQADVGLVVSEGNNNFSPACDGVLSEKVFSQLTHFLQFIERSRWIIYLSYCFALLYNVIGLSFAVQGKLSPVIAAILMPLSSISIILLGILGSWYLGRKLLKNIEKMRVTKITNSE